MIELEAVSTYVYNICRVLTDPLLSVHLCPCPDLSLDVSRIILLLLQALGIPPSFFYCGLLFIIYSSPAVSCPPSLELNLIDTLRFVWDL